MAAPSYTTDLQVVNAADSATGWAELTGHGSGAAPSATTEAFIHNGTAIDQATGQALGTAAGVEFDYGSNISGWVSGWVFLAWQMFAAPTNIYNWSAGGMRFGVGSTTGNIKFWNALGDDFGNYPYGGWQNTAIDPEVTADATEGSSVAGNYRIFGSLPNMRNKITKGSPHVVDAIRYGRGQLLVIGGDVSNGYGTFAGMATANDNATTGRWGLFSYKGGTYAWKGLMSLGSDATAVDFRDQNKTITLEDTPRVSSTFNRCEVRNAGSRVDWTSITILGVQTSITGAAPVSPGDFVAVANADINFDGNTFADLGAFTFQSVSTILGTTFRRCGQVTQGGATITGGLFDKSTAASSLLSNNPGALSGITFISDGGNHAIEINTPGTYTLSGHTFSGYAASNGSTGNEVIYNNSGGAVTLNVSDCAGTISYRNGSGASTTVNNTVNLTITANVSLVGAEIRIYDLDNTLPNLGTELAGTESHNSATYTYGGAASNVIWIQIMKPGYEEFGQQYTMPSVNSNLDVVLQADLNT